MIYVTSDLHGYQLEKFKRMLKGVGFRGRDYLFVLGDVIDRNGDGGVETLEWMMVQPNVELLLGNHEAMLLGCAFLFQIEGHDLVNHLKEEQMRALRTRTFFRTITCAKSASIRLRGRARAASSGLLGSGGIGGFARDVRKRNLAAVYGVLLNILRHRYLGRVNISVIGEIHLDVELHVGTYGSALFGRGGARAARGA